MLQRIFGSFLLVFALLPALDSHAGTVQLPASGQTISYATGDDGAIQAGVAWPSSRFTDNGNGSITDNLTGLVWLKNANCTETVGGIDKTNGYLTWANALTWSNNLASGKCGLTDGSSAGQWRLPNRKELQSLIDRSKNSPVLPAGHPFSTIKSDSYWSSSSYAMSVYCAWVVFMNNGYVTSYGKGYDSYVWPVRGGQGGALGPLALTVALAGTGSGSVHSSPLTDISCIKGSSSGCSASFTTGSVVTLTATPDSNTSTFDGWSGDCTGEPCSVTMNADKNVTAAFTLIPLARNKTTNTPYATLADALEAAASSAELLLLGAQHDGVVSLNKSIILNGGWNTTYQSKSGLPSTLNGNLTILNGDSVAEDVVVKGQLVMQGGSLRANNVTVQP